VALDARLATTACQLSCTANVSGVRGCAACRCSTKTPLSATSSLFLPLLGASPDETRAWRRFESVYAKTRAALEKSVRPPLVGRSEEACSWRSADNLSLHGVLSLVLTEPAPPLAYIDALNYSRFEASRCSKRDWGDIFVMRAFAATTLVQSPAVLELAEAAGGASDGYAWPSWMRVFNQTAEVACCTASLSCSALARSISRCHLSVLR